MTRLVDGRRPALWWSLQLVSPRYRAQWESRHLPDWQRLLARRGTFSPGLPFLYVHAPKAASSSVRALLLAGLRRRFSGESGRRLLVSGPEQWQETLRRAGDPKVVRFSFALHPVTRALAAFNDLFITGLHPYAWRHRRHLRRSGLRPGEASEANFSRFLDYVEEVLAESREFCDPHLREQWRNLLLDHVDYTELGRVESFDADMRRIAGRIGLGHWLTDDLLTVERNRSGGAGPFESPSDNQVERIGRIYVEDIRRLGYATEPDGLRRI